MDTKRQADFTQALIDVIRTAPLDGTDLSDQFPDLHTAIEELTDALQIEPGSPDTIIEAHLHQLFK